MSEHLHHFQAGRRCWAVALPFRLDDWMAEWSILRRVMIRSVPEPFTRDEWAYLVAFLDAANLRKPFEQCFGDPANGMSASPVALARPRGPVAVWLPNNVSLLGPLTLVLISLTGNPVRLKAASQAHDLAEAFLAFARAHLASGLLAVYLQDQVRIERFDRHDPRNADMAKTAAVRIVFGSDDAVAAIDALPHPPDSIGIAFSDRQSEAWIEPARLNEDTFALLIKVFAIYGQAGCTSPRRVVLLGGDASIAQVMKDTLLHLWPTVIRRDVPVHIASQNIMVRQWAAALGWQADLAPGNSAVVAVGSVDLEPASGMMLLPIVTATAPEASERLPANIQTLGHALVDSQSPAWLELISRTAIKRFVPLGQMHHFGAVWDGFAFWRQLFEEVEIAT